MTATTDSAAPHVGGQRAHRAERASGPQGRSTRVQLLPRVGLLGTLALVMLASLAWGAREIPIGHVWEALLQPSEGVTDHGVVRDQRLPRTVVGLCAGIALGVTGALMQGLTRNPIADPGLLGINSGASLAVVLALVFTGVGTPLGHLWFAFLGAAGAAVVVYAVASVGWEGATPIKLALVGAAFTAMATSVITLVLLSDRSVLSQYRFWSVGSLTNRSWDVLLTVLPFVAVGLVLALATGRFLNAMALGDDLARGLGQNPVVGRTLVLLAVVLLAGSATALAGPIAFVGLMVPHVARAFAGPDYRWILPLSAVAGPVVLLTSDIVGRLVLRPAELEVGLVVALLGAPVLIALVRRSAAASA